ncbi:MAG: nitroreductase family protein [Saprospiraceae bacterium]|jgi:nitroreductase|nr:nitroreductase [Chitinophagia bacterium]
MDFTIKRFEELSHIMHERRSVFPSSFTGEFVNDEILVRILDNANQSPSHRHTEPWRFHVVSGNAKKRFARFMQDSYKIHFEGENFNLMKYNKIAKKIDLTSHIIMISMHRDEHAAVPEWEEIAAVSCSVQNIYLSLTAAGLGGYWSTPAYFIRESRSFFKMHESEQCLGLFYVGVPKEDLPPRMEKRPVGEKVKFYRN